MQATQSPSRSFDDHLDASGSVSEAARAENRALATSVATGFLDHYADLNAPACEWPAVSTLPLFAGGWFSNPWTPFPNNCSRRRRGGSLGSVESLRPIFLKEETPTVVLFVTDGQTTDTPTPDLLRNIQLPGVPVFTLDLARSTKVSFRRISDFTSGRFHVAPLSTLSSSLQELVDREVETNYAFRYVASSAVISGTRRPVRLRRRPSNR
ncbi:MAG: hypothetical protein R3F19_02850 [Verrucomicrobiales bacterium]